MSSHDDLYRQQVEHYYREHHGWVKAWLQRRLGNNQDAAELAHDVFLRLLNKPRQFESTTHVRAHLSSVSHHVWVDFWRHRQIEQTWQETLASQPAAYAPSEEHRALVLEALHEVHTMLARLPERVAETFLLVQLEGWSYRQISQHLGVSERTITKYMAQAMFQCLLLEAELDKALD